MLLKIILVCLPLALAQIPLYLRTPALPSSIVAAAPVAQLQCAQQCMPSCLPSCLVAQSPAYQPYQAALTVPQPVAASPVASAVYQPYGTGLAYYPVVPTCAAACMPTCAPTCVATPAPLNPQRDDLPTPPPETVPTPAPELQTTSAPAGVVPCKCLIKITVTQGNSVLSKCGPAACACPQGYSQCGSSNCCKA